MIFRKKKKKVQQKSEAVYAFIDSQNLNLGTQKMGWKMNWRKFREFLKNEYGVTKAYMFIGYMVENEKLYTQMHDAGYLVVLKPTSDLTKAPRDEKDNEDKKTIKGNIDVEMTLWVMKEKKNFTKAILVSGDGDFYSLAEHLEEQGKLLKILTPNWQYSSLLKRFDSKIDRLDKRRRELSYANVRKQRSSSDRR
jgi:uncharacterized LabA/DUF88 family protein